MTSEYVLRSRFRGALGVLLLTVRNFGQRVGFFVFQRYLILIASLGSRGEKSMRAAKSREDICREDFRQSKRIPTLVLTTMNQMSDFPTLPDLVIVMVGTLCVPVWHRKALELTRWIVAVCKEVKGCPYRQSSPIIHYLPGVCSFAAHSSPFRGHVRMEVSEEKR